ncbi:hypothetical protein OHA77_13200 [Streptosporangium sp. NBC_01639]|uniref:hypothetical protein n=1 Tax=unclassified Streptosporangium TaxID=2632669 RepID=UPI002DDAA439|nr:hypothetical protein [Streptosporangium sp. NBC_01756]WSC83965.1 hypothetical protein OIE48_26660 [Streptosporangium sp. NBC_01756]WTD57443.1 hypothetical protein OHA77_13200 [Streptosporangium sp. NBC_01639]
MSDPQLDPSGSTQQFRAFAQRNEPEAAPQKRSLTVPIAVAVAVVVVIAIAAYLIL